MTDCVVGAVGVEDARGSEWLCELGRIAEFRSFDRSRYVLLTIEFDCTFLLKQRWSTFLFFFFDVEHVRGFFLLLPTATSFFDILLEQLSLHCR